MSIFKDAKFGDVFFTRKGKKVILIGFHPYVVAIETASGYDYPYKVEDNGRINKVEFETDYDVVSKLDIDLSKEEFDNIVEEHFEKYSLKYDGVSRKEHYDAFKEGYLTAIRINNQRNNICLVNTILTT